MRQNDAVEAISARRSAEEFQREGQAEDRPTELDRQLAQDERSTVVDRDALADRRLAEANEALAAADRRLADAGARLQAATEAQRAEAQANLRGRLEDYSIKLDEALEAFAETYPEIMAEPFLASYADRRYDQARAEGKSEEEALKAAGESTRGYVKSLGRSLGMHERAARERREVQGEPLDARGVIAEMAASRPGAIAAAHREQIASGE